ncbi:CocE/NonD family hydrolase [Nocardia sp. NPDC051570]|uniref:CocE/NonD family hydrolase n=1 Tax=Nocardia sp. NPDC051570 TaxID=3364324 RepID=UPI0037B23104
MRRLSITAVTAAAAATLLVNMVSIGAAAADTGPGTWQARPAGYDVVIDHDVPIRMSDGVRLAADIRRPGHGGQPAEGRFPVLVTQTPYNKNTPGLNFADDYLVQHGYVQVVVDVRGTGASEGDWGVWSDREQRDGKEIVEWAASPDQPWSDGRIGLTGASYGAVNQFFTAALHPRGLKALFPAVPVGDLYRDVVMTGGQFAAGLSSGLVIGLIAIPSALPPGDALEDPVRAARVVLEHLANTSSFKIPLLASALSGGQRAFDGPFFAERSANNVIDQVQVPTFLVGGHFEFSQRSGPLLYQQLVANHVPSRLLLGPWYHLDAAFADGGNTAPGLLPPWQGPSLPELQLRWFDHYVRGDADPDLEAEQQTPITYQELGSQQWKTATQWPPADTRSRKLTLAGPATPGRPGRLSTGEESGGPDLLPWNPLAGACSMTTAVWSAGTLGRGICDGDQRNNDATGLTYDLPVTEPLTLTGPINAHLSVATPGRDGQLTVRVEDLAPDGNVTFLTAGWQSLSLRKLDESRSEIRDGLIVRPWHPYTEDSVEPVPANIPVPVDIEVLPTAAVIAPGHTLRVAIQTEDFPHLTPPIPQELASIGAGITISHDTAAPSWITLSTVN